MKNSRTEQELDELIDLARNYCSELARYRETQAGGPLSAEDDEQARRKLSRLSRKLELLKSNSELDRTRARATTRIIPMDRFKRKAAR